MQSFVIDGDVLSRHHPLGNLREVIKRPQAGRFDDLLWETIGECGLGPGHDRGHLLKDKLGLAGSVYYRSCDSLFK